MNKKVSILMGSKSDLPIMNKAIEILKDFNIAYDINILSAHRTPHETIQHVETSDADVFIAGAGGAAHLPGVIAGISIKPVIGVPINSSISIRGIDSREYEFRRHAVHVRSHFTHAPQKLQGLGQIECDELLLQQA